MTWYPQQYLDKLPMTTMDMRPNPSADYPGRTYRFYKGPVVYPFGHGMSYTNFLYTVADAPKLFSVPIEGHHHSNGTIEPTSLIRVTHARCDKLSLSLGVDVRNTGSKDGTHTLLVFSSPPGVHWAPHKQLVAFQKVFVPAGGQERVIVKVHVCKYLSVVDPAGVRRIPMGDHALHIGDVMHTVSLEAQALGVIKS